MKRNLLIIFSILLLAVGIHINYFFPQADTVPVSALSNPQSSALSLSGSPGIAFKTTTVNFTDLASQQANYTYRPNATPVLMPLPPGLPLPDAPAPSLS